MQKLIVVVVMLLYCLGNILFPYVDMAHIEETYKHCAIEDPDINAADFVFEHLLNIPDFFDCLEYDENGESEQPHQPIHIVYASGVAVVLGTPIVFECSKPPIYYTTIAYPVFCDNHFPGGFPAKMLRPPIV